MMHEKWDTLYRVSIYDKAGSARRCVQADHGSLERSSVCVVWGCNESPPRVERGSADWEGSHTIAKRIFPTDSARGIETPRSSPVRASFQRKECLSACRYVVNTRSLIVFNITNVSYVDKIRVLFVLRENSMTRHIIAKVVRKNESAVSPIA